MNSRIKVDVKLSKIPKIISIEGNIGSGKSTIITFLSNNLSNYLKINHSNHLKIEFLEEPVKEWNNFTDNDGVNIIENYYKDQKKYAFQFQMMAYISRVTQLKEAISKGFDVIFIERSILTDKNVFAKMLYDEKKNRRNRI